MLHDTLYNYQLLLVLTSHGTWYTTWYPVLVAGTFTRYLVHFLEASWYLYCTILGTLLGTSTEPLVGSWDLVLGTWYV